MYIIETINLSRTFGRKSVVDQVNLRVPERCVYGFLGPNGAGKTTTMRLLLGLLKPTSGSVYLLGHDLLVKRQRALAGVGALIERGSLYDHLSGRANLELARLLLDLPATEIDRVLEVVDLHYASSDRVAAYSLGMRQRLALARALLGAPRLLLLDEPTNGLDPDGIVAMRALITNLPEQTGCTVFVSSHLLSEVEQTADEVCVLNNGQIVLQGRVSQLLRNTATVKLTLDRAKEGSLLLVASGYSARVVDDVNLWLNCGSEDRAAVARANSILVEAGFAVSAIVPSHKSLEDLYRQSLDGFGKDDIGRVSENQA